MRKLYIFRKMFAFSIIFLCASSTFAQFRVGELIKSGPEDATKLAQAYLNPFFKGIGVGLNTGWHNTANVKNVGRFELRAGISGASVPQSNRMFDVTKLGLSNTLRPSNASNVMAPTFAGSKSNGPSMDIYDSNNNKIESFNLPGGTGFSIVPVPQLQGSIGLPKGIELDLRATPTINLGAKVGSVGMIGGGVKIEVLQLFTGKTAKKILPIDLAVAAGYTQINYKLDLDVKPSNNAQPDPAKPQSNDFSDQKIEAKLSGINVEAILSKKLLFFTPFISVGYNGSTTKADLKGNYPITTGAIISSTPTPTYTTFSNPVSINQKDISGLRTNLGFQLNLAFFRMYASYSMAEYNTFNAGVGFGIGK